MKNIDLDNMAQYDTPYEILHQLAKNQVDLQRHLNGLTGNVLDIFKMHQTIQTELFEIIVKQQDLILRALGEDTESALEIAVRLNLLRTQLTQRTK